MADQIMRDVGDDKQCGSWVIMSLISLTGAGLLVMADEGVRLWQENLLTWLGWLWALLYGASGIYALTDAWKLSQSGPAKRVLGRVAVLMLVVGLAANGFYVAASIAAVGALFSFGRIMVDERKAGGNANG